MKPKTPSSRPPRQPGQPGQPGKTRRAGKAAPAGDQGAAGQTGKTGKPGKTDKLGKTGRPARTGATVGKSPAGKPGQARRHGPGPRGGKPVRGAAASASGHPPAPAPSVEGRIAKVIARAGLASRREAERMIEAGRVAVNGKVIDGPALNVTARDRITVDGQPLEAPAEPGLWLYHKPRGLVCTARDEQGRATIFDKLPEDMPRVMSVGRLDLNSEGLLLLTNDGALKRKLELPETGWLRKYRVRVNGRVDDAALEPLRSGIEVEGERFQPMLVTLDRQQGANAWLTVGLREGRNREVRRALQSVGYVVNRLIRVSYGPFQLGQLKPGDVQKIRPKVLRDQLGAAAPDTDAEEAPTPPRRRRRPPKSPTRR